MEVILEASLKHILNFHDSTLRCIRETEDFLDGCQDRLLRAQGSEDSEQAAHWGQKDGTNAESGPDDTSEGREQKETPLIGRWCSSRTILTNISGTRFNIAWSILAVGPRIEPFCDDLQSPRLRNLSYTNSS
ncbi:unnamed protein product [Caretta caretta]